MNLAALNQKVNRVFALISAWINFIPEFFSSTAQDVTVTWPNEDESTTTQTHPNLAKLISEFPLPITENITYQVGAGGDYATINAALEDVVKKHGAGYKNTGLVVTLNLVAGFIVTEQVVAQNIDLSWIKITGDDAETTIDASGFIDISVLDYHPTNMPTFGAKNAKLPQIGQLFSTTGGGTENNGIHLESGSSVVVHGGCGVKSAGQHGIVAFRNSDASIAMANFTNSGEFGVYAVATSKIDAEGVDVSGAGSHGIYALRKGEINAQTGNASNVGAVGVFADDRSSINFNSGVATNTGSHSVFARSLSSVDAEYSSCTTDGSPAEEYAVTGGGTVAIRGASGETNTNISGNTITSSGIIYS